MIVICPHIKAEHSGACTLFLKAPVHVHRLPMAYGACHMAGTCIAFGTRTAHTYNAFVRVFGLSLKLVIGVEVGMPGPAKPLIVETHMVSSFSVLLALLHAPCVCLLEK